MTDTTCGWCNEDVVFGLDDTIFGCDVLVGEREAFLTWRPCCEGMRGDVEHYGFEDAYGISVEDVASLIGGWDVLEVLGHGDGCVIARLTIKDPTEVVGHHKAKSPKGWQKEVFADIDEHHSHHDAPTGWKYGLAVLNGPIKVGVMVVGNPVSRMLMKANPDTLEVVRGCVLPVRPELRKNAASKLYSAAGKTARRLGYDHLVTYTLAEESGHSLVASGWTPTAESRGGSWDRPSRERDEVTSSKGATTSPKVRWEKGLTKKTRKAVAARQTERSRPSC